MNGGAAGGFFARAGSARRFFRDLGPGLITGAADDDTAEVRPGADRSAVDARREDGYEEPPVEPRVAGEARSVTDSRV